MRMVVNPNSPSSSSAPPTRQVQQLPPYNQQQQLGHHQQQQQLHQLQSPLIPPTLNSQPQPSPANIPPSASSVCSSAQYPLGGVTAGCGGGAYSPSSVSGGSTSFLHHGGSSSGALSRDYSNISSQVDSATLMTPPTHIDSGSSGYSSHHSGDDKSASVSSTDEIDLSSSLRPPASIASTDSTSTFKRVTRRINPYNKEAPWIVVSSTVVPKHPQSALGTPSKANPEGSCSEASFSASSSFQQLPGVQQQIPPSFVDFSSPSNQFSTTSSALTRDPAILGASSSISMNAQSMISLSSDKAPSEAKKKKSSLSTTRFPEPIIPSPTPCNLSAETTSSQTITDVPTNNTVPVIYSPEPSEVRHDALLSGSTPIPYVSFRDVVSHREVHGAQVLNISNTQRKESLQRLFLGQLPYDVTPKMVTEICLAVTGRPVVMAETITKRDSKTGVLTSTGCSHAYCRQEDVEHVLAVMNKQILVDANGIWVAKTQAQADELNRYSSKIKKDLTKRFPGLPIETVVAQIATSRYKAKTAGSRSSAPPPKHTDPRRVTPNQPPQQQRRPPQSGHRTSA